MRMSQQLSKIRSLISDIEEIQKLGQRSHAEPSVLHSAGPQLTQTNNVQQFSGQAQAQSQSEPAVSPVPPLAATPPPAEVFEIKPQAPQELGRLAMQLTGNVVLQLQIDESDEIVEIRQVQIQKEIMIEIRFNDGKAFHLPLKSVA